MRTVIGTLTVFARWNADTAHVLKLSDTYQEGIESLIAKRETRSDSEKTAGVVLRLIKDIGVENLDTTDARNMLGNVISANSAAMHDVAQRCLQCLLGKEAAIQSSDACFLLRKYCALKSKSSAIRNISFRQPGVETLKIAEMLADKVDPMLLVSNNNAGLIRSLPATVREAILTRAAEKVLSAEDGNENFAAFVKGVMTLAIRYCKRCLSRVMGVIDVKKVAGKMMQVYVEKVANVKEVSSSASDRMDPYMRSPVLAIVKAGRKDPQFALSLLQQFPAQPHIFSIASDLRPRVERRLRSMFDSLTPLEVALIFKAPQLAAELLSVPGYAKYAREHMEMFMDLALRTGNAGLFSKLRELFTQSITLAHMHIALENCSQEFCVSLIKDLKSNFTPSEILEHADPFGNTVLHHVAKNGLRTVLLLLSELGIFDLSPAVRKNYRAYLLKKNSDKLSPFVLALQSDNLDLVSLLYVSPENLAELSDTEFKLVTAPSSTTRAFSAFTNPELYSKAERKIWETLFPERERIVKLLQEKTGNLPIRGSTRRAFARKMVAETGIEHVKKLISVGAIGSILHLAMFRRDLFEVAALLEPKFQVIPKLYYGLSGDASTMPLIYVFRRLKIAPRTKEMVEPLMLNKKSCNDLTYLMLMQALEVLRINSADSFDALRKEPGDSVFLSPCSALCHETAKPLFSSDELDLLLPPISASSAVQYYGLDLAQLASHFAACLCFKAFATVVLFAQRFDPELMKRIKAKVNVEQLLTMLFEQNPAELPWGIAAFGEDMLRVSLDPAEKPLDADLESTRIKLTSNTLSGLLFCALYHGDRMIRVLHQNFSGLQLVQEVFRRAVEQAQKWVYTSPPKKRRKYNIKLNSRKEVPGLNSAIRSSQIWLQTLSRALTLPQCGKLTQFLSSSSSKISGEKMMLSESDLARMVAECLYSYKIFATENGFMEIEIEGGVDAILSAGASIAKPQGMRLPLAVSTLFTSKFIFGLEAIKDQVYERDYIMHVRIKLGKEGGQSCRMVSLKEKVAIKKAAGYKTDFEADVLDIEYALNPVEMLKAGDENASKILSEFNRKIYSEFTAAKLSLAPPLKFVQHKTVTREFAIEPIKGDASVIPLLVADYFKDIQPQVLHSCKTEVSHLLDTVLRYKRTVFQEQRSFEKSQNPKALSQMPATLRPIAGTKCKIRLMSAEDWKLYREFNTETEYVRKSLQVCCGKGMETVESELILVVGDEKKKATVCAVFATYIEYPAARLFYAEASFRAYLTHLVRWHGPKLSYRQVKMQKPAERITAPPMIRVDVKGLCENIFIPLSEAFRKSGIDTMKEFALPTEDPVLLVEDYLGGGRVNDILRQFVTDLGTLESRFGGGLVKAVNVCFEETGVETKSMAWASGLFDSLIRITGLDITLDPETGVCKLKFRCYLSWKKEGIKVPSYDDAQPYTEVLRYIML